MRAVVWDRYGPPEVLRLDEVDRPVPRDDEVLIRVRAATVTRSDVGFRSGRPFVSRLLLGPRRPKWRIPGLELAGEVEAVGAAVREFVVGDRVFGVNANGMGAHAEFVCVNEAGPLAKMPDGITFAEAAAACDGAALALGCFRTAGLREGQSILIYGATGSVGTAAIQLARVLGAGVTAVGNTKNLELMRSLGAQEIIDYTEQDFTRNGKTYDVVFDAVGLHSFRRARRSVRRGGTYVDTDPGFMWHVLPLALLTRWVGDRKVKLGFVHYSKQDVLFVKELIEAGKFRPVIDRTYPLEVVVEATRYVETGQKTGNVVLTVGGAR